jgi:hypothetical protein
MSLNKWNIVGFAVLATLTSAFAGKAKYSGIYNLNTGEKVLLAVTKGGHLLSLGNDTSIADELDPAKSTVSSTGKVVGKSSSGLTVAASISSDFKVKGTAKSGNRTIRITGSRVLN